MFDSIRTYSAFNYSSGIIFNYDLDEFPTVYMVLKVRGKRQYDVLTFFGPLRLQVKTFNDRSFQCFVCFEFGHNQKDCTNSPLHL